ncbi:MAG: hypothetical protein ABIO94_12220 [Opitutaceae bacterium]
MKWLGLITGPKVDVAVNYWRLIHRKSKYCANSLLKPGECRLARRPKIPCHANVQIFDACRETQPGPHASANSAGCDSVVCGTRISGGAVDEIIATERVNKRMVYHYFECCTH